MMQSYFKAVRLDATLAKLLVLTMSITCAGCASSQEYAVKLIDAQSRRPLAGASIDIYPAGVRLGNRFLSIETAHPRKYQSDDAGTACLVLEVRGEERYYTVHIRLPGYCVVIGTIYPGTFSTYLVYHEGDPFGKATSTVRKTVNGVIAADHSIVIPMLPISGQERLDRQTTHASGAP